MIYPGHSKFYKKDGFILVKKFINNQRYGLIYGRYKECNVYLTYIDTKYTVDNSAGFLKNSIVTHISISIIKNSEQQVQETVTELKLYPHIDSASMDDEGFLVVRIKNNRKSLRYKSVKECIEYICDILHKYQIYNDKCESCKENPIARTILVQGNPTALCDECIAELKKNADIINKAYESIPNNYLKGLFGGVLAGALSGTAASTIFTLCNITNKLKILIGIIIILFATFMGAKIGYTKIGGKFTIKGRLIIMLAKLLSYGIVFIEVVLGDYFTNNINVVFDMATILKVLSNPMYETKFVGGLMVVSAIFPFFLEGMLFILNYLAIPQGERDDNVINIEE
jgi:nitrate reductase NapAB chaperone NapD